MRGAHGVDDEGLEGQVHGPEELHVASERIESTEEHTLRVLPADGHSGLLPSGGPRRAQWRKLTQEGLVLEEEHRAFGQPSQPTDKRSFFWGRWGAFSEKT